MEINMGIPDDFCQGNAHPLEPIEPEEYMFPLEDKVRPKSIKVQRGDK